MRKGGILLPAAALLSACAGGPPLDAEADPVYLRRLADGLQRLGASEARSRCFADRLARSGETTAEDATRIVEESSDRKDMRRRVLDADSATRKAFIGANFGCSLAQ